MQFHIFLKEVDYTVICLFCFGPSPQNWVKVLLKKISSSCDVQLADNDRREKQPVAFVVQNALNLTSILQIISIGHLCTHSSQTAAADCLFV